ncbi:MAG TPA: HAD-IB family hydrolase [Candidatus Paceibacterota bacterium]|nr:HAD-IB family hydrolase [Candidatus Paceibacterota bacterium]
MTQSKVALFDICNTLVEVTTITDFTERYLLAPGKNPYARYRTRIYHFVWRFLRGRTHLLDRYSSRDHLVMLFKGYTEEDLRPLVEAYTARLRDCIKRPVRERLEQLRREGYELYLVSAGLDAYLRPFAAELGVTLIATTLERDEHGVYTGRVLGTDCIGEGKVRKMHEVIPHFADIDWKASYAFGDSYSDIPMLELVGHPWAVDPDAALAAEADARRWNVLRTGQ